MDEKSISLYRDEIILKSILNRPRKTSTKEFIYVISNPIFPGWFKVGRTLNLKLRLISYNICDPNKKFKIEFSMESNYASIQETIIKRIYKSDCEWIKEDIIENLISIIKSTSL